MFRPPQMMPKPHMHPGICAGCGVADAGRKYFVDTGITYDYEGNVYLCNCCLEDIFKATQGEFLSRAQVDELIGIQTEILGKAAIITENYERLREFFENIGIDFKKLIEYFEEQRKNERGITTADVNSSDGFDGTSSILDRSLSVSFSPEYNPI